MKNYLKLLSFLKDHRRLFSTAVFTMFVASIFEGFQLSLLVPMTDRIFNNKKIAVPGNLPRFISDFVDKLKDSNLQMKALSVLKMDPNKSKRLQELLSMFQ